MVETTLGRKLREARQRKKMTLEQLAASSGVSTGRISEIENGKTAHPRKDTLMSLATALEVDPLVLIDDQVESVWTAFEVNKLDIPNDVKDWLLQRASSSWIRIAEQCTAADISPEEALEYLQTIIRVKERTENKIRETEKK